MTTRKKGPESSSTDWGSIPHGEHCVQVYRDESSLLRSLVDFVRTGFRAGDSAVVIATAAHRSSLSMWLRAEGHDLDALEASGRYTVLDAADTLSRFMVGGAPDQERLEATIREALAPAHRSGRKIRLFGEMVALLWNQGNGASTLQLERLWDDFSKQQGVTLFCAYPCIGATRDLGESLAEVCAVHSRVLVAA